MCNLMDKILDTILWMTKLFNKTRQVDIKEADTRIKGGPVPNSPFAPLKNICSK